MSSRLVERRIVSVLFADLVGFTALSERLDAEDVALVQDAYFEAVRETIDRYGGQLEKFIGDAVMAVFGAPRVRDDDAERAVRAGVALIAAVERLGASLGLEERALRLRVGVNSGEAVYGEATAERGPVTGDTVNVAARLQAAAEPGSVVLGAVTALAVADTVELEPLDPLELKGKSEAVNAWRVVEVFAERSRERALGGMRAPMIGRQAELARLVERLEERTGRILVVAPPGVGKTRLLDELAGEAASRAAVVLRARLRPDLLSPFEPIGQLLRSGLDGSDLRERLAQRLSPGRAEVVADALATVVAPVSAAGGAAGREERDQLFRAWLDGLDAVAGAPTVWLVEDLHWASGDLLAFLEAASGEPSTSGRLIVGTARPTLLETAAPWCAAGEVLDLPPLLEADTEALVRALVGDVLPAQVVEGIAEVAGGNALFVEELLRMWASTGILVRDAESWTVAVDPSDVALPATVQAIYAGQLDDLPPTARNVARNASVAGRRFAIAAFGALDISDADDAVEALARRSLVSGPWDDPVLGTSFTYRHALLRDAGYASLARAERARLHARLAEWLANLPEHSLATIAEVVARHYAAALDNAPELMREIAGRTRADIRAAAADWFERAADVALQFAAWESARTLASRAVELTEPGDLPSRARRLERLATATANAVGLRDAETLFREALDLYRSTDGPHRAGIASTGSALGMLLRAQTRFAEAEQLATALLEEIGTEDEVAAARLLLLRSVAVLNAWDDHERADVDARAALKVARRSDDQTLELEALHLVAQIGAERGDDNRAEWERLERLARELRRWEIVTAALMSGGLADADDRPEAVLPVLDEAREIAEAHGLVEARGWCDYAQSEAHFAAGSWDAAVAAATSSLALGTSHGFDRLVVRSWFVLLPIARARAGDDAVRQAFPHFDARRDREPKSPYARIVATAAHLLFAAAGLEPDFVPELEPRIASFELAHGGASWLAAVETVVAKWLDAEQRSDAERALDVMRERLDRGGCSRLALATEAILRGRLHLARGEHAAALAEAEAALAKLAGPAPWWRAKALRLQYEAGGGARSLHEAQSIEASLGIVSP